MKPSVINDADAPMNELTLEQAAQVLGISPRYFRRCHEALKLHPPFTLEKLAPYVEPRLTGTLPDDVKAKIASLMPPSTTVPVRDLALLEGPGLLAFRARTRDGHLDDHVV